MLIIRDIGVYKLLVLIGFWSQLEVLLRVLSTRLKELERQGFIECNEHKRSPVSAHWSLTDKGRDTLPILMQLLAFGCKWYSDIVFEDKVPKRLTDIFPQRKAN